MTFRKKRTPAPLGKKSKKGCTRNTTALKVGSRLLDLDPTAVERFKREFTIIQRLRHPHLVAALEFGEQNNVPYMAQEYVAGQSLEKRVQAQGPLPIADALLVIAQVAEGLRHLHQKNIVHRDIKPGNVLLDERGRAKLGDFGLLKELTGVGTLLTRAKQPMGTPEYAAPEQFEDASKVDARCDVYALAGTLYTALTGQFPFGLASQMRILQRKSANQFAPLEHWLPTAPAALTELVARSLAADRHTRPASCEEFLMGLGAAREALSLARPARQGRLPPEPSGSSRSGPERRAHVRVGVSLPAVLAPFYQAKRGSWKATILDVSRGGFCLRTAQAFPVNTLLEVTLGRKATSYLIQVRWVKGSDQDSILGCALVRPLAGADLADLCQGGTLKTKGERASAGAVTARPPSAPR